MNRLARMAALVRADVLERTRCYQYFALVAVTLLVGTLLLPGRNANYETFLIDNYRGVYNSAWVGASCALLATMLLSLFGFYFVKSAVERDRTTRVGEIVAATSIGRFEYALGKVLSNFVVLLSMTAILFGTAIVMLFVRGESTAFDLGAIVAPFALAVLPTIAMVAALGVFFEMIPWLRAGLGNVIYFFGWMAYLVWSFQANLRAPWWRDLLGGNLILRQVWHGVLRIDPHARPDSMEIGAMFGKTVPRFFTLDGFHWTSGDVTDRLMWFAIAAVVTVAASLAFDRFALPARDARQRRTSPFTAHWLSVFEGATTPLLDTVFGSAFGAIVLAELRLLVRGLSPWWYLVAAGFWIFQLFADAKTQSIAVGLAWIWPLLVWSQLGTREHVYGTEELVYPTLHPLRRQFASQWLAGVLLALATAGGSLIHWTLSGTPVGVEGILTGAIFVPSLALACGALSGTTRLFEIAYLVLWYVGPLNRTIFDFTQTANAPGFLLASLVLLTAAFGARALRLQHA